MWKNRFLVFVVFICGIVTIVGYQGSNLGYIVVYSTILMTMFAFVSISLAHLLIRPTENLDYHTSVKDEPQYYSIILKNLGPFFYPKSKLIFHNSDIIRYNGILSSSEIRPFAKSKIGFELSIPYRGVYRAGIEHILVTDFLGLFTRKIKVHGIMTIVVYPKYNKNATIPIKNEAQIPSLMQDYIAETDNTTVADIRKYNSSDSPKKIHWALTAKKAQLLVKEYSPLVTKKVAVYIDLLRLPLSKKAGAQLEDIIISHVAGSLSYLLESNLLTVLILGSESGVQQEFENSSQMQTILETLARVSFDQQASVSNIMATFSRDFNTVFYLTDIDNRIYSVIESLVSYETKTIVYYFYCDEMPILADKGLMLDSLKEYGVYVNRINVF